MYTCFALLIIALAIVFILVIINGIQLYYDLGKNNNHSDNRNNKNHNNNDNIISDNHNNNHNNYDCICFVLGVLAI